MRETARDKTYTMGTLLSVLGISRGTLRYYEQLGIIEPKREAGSNYRIYTNADIFRLVGYFLMGNAGYSVQDAQALLNRKISNKEFVAVCLRKNAAHRLWCEAQEEMLTRLSDGIEEEGTPRVRLVLDDRWRIYFDNCQEGYENFDSNEIQDVLLRNMPISSFGSVFEGDFFAEQTCLPHWGRIINERYVSLFPELEHSGREYRLLGGCPCAVVSYSAPADMIPGFDKSYKYRRLIAEFLRRHRLAADGEGFTTRALPVGETFYAEVHLPVRATSLFSRLLLGRIKRRSPAKGSGKDDG